MARSKGKRILANQNCQPIDRLLVWQVPTIQQAIRLCRRPVFKGHSKHDDGRDMVITAGFLKPSESDLRRLIERSDDIIDEALLANPMLARRSRWVRDEDGVFADAALVALGDDRPCFTMKRRSIAETFGEQRKRIVISTDCNQKASMEMAAAVIATIRIVQQWQPIDVWWQGAWLSEDERRGYVFHVPLIEGDMDFAKIMFFLASPYRDSFSWEMMATESVSRGYSGWNETQNRAERSYLEGTDVFVDHRGIRAGDVESYAAWWLGLPSQWQIVSTAEREATGALQEIAVPRQQVPETEEERRDRERSYAKWKEEQKAARQREAAERGRHITA